VAVRSRKIDDGVAGRSCLFAGRAHDSVDGGVQAIPDEFDDCVAEVDDCACELELC
jgi:hypothetical protein